MWRLFELVHNSRASDSMQHHMCDWFSVRLGIFMSHPFWWIINACYEGSSEQVLVTGRERGSPILLAGYRPHWCITEFRCQTFGQVTETRIFMSFSLAECWTSDSFIIFQVCWTSSDSLSTPMGNVVHHGMTSVCLWSLNFGNISAISGLNHWSCTSVRQKIGA